MYKDTMPRLQISAPSVPFPTNISGDAVISGQFVLKASLGPEASVPM